MILLYFLVSLQCFSWTKQEVKLYNERRFPELELKLYLKQEVSEAKLIKKQREDLQGCKEIKNSSQKASAFIACLEFINREKQLKISDFSKNRDMLEDLNLFCVKKSAEKSFLDTLLIRKPLINAAFMATAMGGCKEALWRQIYLTTAANFSADPVGSMKIIRMARHSLGANKQMEEKLIKFTSPF